MYFWVVLQTSWWVLDNVGPQILVRYVWSIAKKKFCLWSDHSNYILCGTLNPWPWLARCNVELRYDRCVLFLDYGIGILWAMKLNNQATLPSGCRVSLAFHRSTLCDTTHLVLLMKKSETNLYTNKSLSMANKKIHDADISCVYMYHFISHLLL